MSGCHTVFYDDIDNKWQFDRINHCPQRVTLSIVKIIILTFKHYQVIKKRIFRN